MFRKASQIKFEAASEVPPQLGKPGQQAFAYEALADLKASKLTNPAMSLKVELGAWESAPILFSKMVELYAVATYGSNWGVERSRTELA
jgi:hypothetical protein